jgi:hypothetical protein
LSFSKAPFGRDIQRPKKEGFSLWQTVELETPPIYDLARSHPRGMDSPAVQHRYTLI